MAIIASWLEDRVYPPSSHDEIQIEDQIKLRYEGIIVTKAVAFPEIVQFVVEIGTDVMVRTAAGIIANWLCEKIKRTALRRAGLRRVHFRDLRHSYAAMLIR